MSVDGEGVALKILMQVMLYEYYSVSANTIAMFSCFTGEQNRKVFIHGFLVEASKEHSLRECQRNETYKKTKNPASD
jgi:hypothetical protein